MKKENMWKTIIMLMILVMLAGCSGVQTGVQIKGDQQSLRVGTTSGCVKYYSFLIQKMKPMGYDVELVIFDDAIAPNIAVMEGTLDVTVHQHTAYLKSYNDSNGTNLVPLEPALFSSVPAITSDKYTSLDEVPDGGKIGIPDDLSNMHRNLCCLELLGLIELASAPSNGDTYAIFDIVSNPQNFEFVEVSTTSIFSIVPDVDFIITTVRVEDMRPGYRVIEVVSNIPDEDPILSTPIVAVVSEENKDAFWVEDFMTALCGDELRKTLEDMNNEVGQEVQVILF